MLCRRTNRPASYSESLLCGQLSSGLLLAALSSITAAKKKQPTTNDAVAAITQFENGAVKADLAGDSSFFEKGYADNWTGIFSGGTWTTKGSDVG
jgi:hypothetical protein